MKKLRSIFLLAIMVFACQTAFAQTIKGDPYSWGMQFFENKEYKKAVDSFREGANQGDPRALFYLGNCYLDGYGVEKDACKNGCICFLHVITEIHKYKTIYR